MAAEILLVNPKKRRKRRKTRARRRNPVRRRRRASTHVTRRRRRRNPVRFRGAINTLVVPAFWGAGGALALDFALGFIPLPANLKTGITGYAVKGASAIALGMLLQNMKLVPAKIAQDMTSGALAVMLHGALKEQIQMFFPQVNLGEYMGNELGFVSSGYPAEGWDDENDMAAYLPNIMDEDMEVGADELGAYVEADDYSEYSSYG